MHLFVLENRPDRLSLAKQRMIVAHDVAVDDRILEESVGCVRIGANDLA